MRTVLFHAVPYSKDDVTLALESGVHGVIAPESEVSAVSQMARCRVIPAGEVREITLAGKSDEEDAVAALRKGRTVLLKRGWEIIPVENLLAHEQLAGKTGTLALEAASVREARLAAGILERGVDTVVVNARDIGELKHIVEALIANRERVELTEAEILEVTPVSLGHRVCVDTLSIMRSGQGMLVGNSAAFTFLVNAETEPNEFVAPRPFRINAGAAHSYAIMPGDRTAYLEELKPGTEILVVDHNGDTAIAVAGRLKVEKRPMLLVRATAQGQEGTVFVQNAETIRLVQPEGKTVSVVALKKGDTVLCRLDAAGRHFGMRIKEEILEE